MQNVKFVKDPPKCRVDFLSVIQFILFEVGYNIIRPGRYKHGCND